MKARKYDVEDFVEGVDRGVFAWMADRCETTREAMVEGVRRAVLEWLDEPANLARLIDVVSRR